MNCIIDRMVSKVVEIALKFSSEVLILIHVEKSKSLIGLVIKQINLIILMLEKKILHIFIKYLRDMYLSKNYSISYLLYRVLIKG